MKTLVLILLLGLGTRAASADQTYTCAGPAVTGTVSIRLSRPPVKGDLFPPYQARSRLFINGRAVTLQCRGDVSYLQREILFGQGAWEYDHGVQVFALCGADLKLSALGEGFHLEVGPRGVRGYLGHRDHLQGPENLSAYDFTCR